MPSGAEGAGFEEALVVAAKFHFADPDAVGVEKELLNLRIGESVEPVVYLSNLVVSEVGEFGWKRLFSHNCILVLLRKNGHRSLCFVGKKISKFKHSRRRPQLNNRPRIRPLKFFPLALAEEAFPRAGVSSEKHGFAREEKICGSCPGRLFSCSRMDQLTWFSKSTGLR